MPRTKKVKPQETPAEVNVDTPPVVAEESPEKKAFKAYMAEYKAKKPVKYAVKEAELIRKLNQL